MSNRSCEVDGRDAAGHERHVKFLVDGGSSVPSNARVGDDVVIDYTTTLEANVWRVTQMARTDFVQGARPHSTMPCEDASVLDVRPGGTAIDYAPPGDAASSSYVPASDGSTVIARSIDWGTPETGWQEGTVSRSSSVRMVACARLTASYGPEAPAQVFTSRQVVHVSCHVEGVFLGKKLEARCYANGRPSSTITLTPTVGAVWAATSLGPGLETGVHRVDLYVDGEQQGSLQFFVR